MLHATTRITSTRHTCIMITQGHAYTCDLLGLPAGVIPVLRRTDSGHTYTDVAPIRPYTDVYPYHVDDYLPMIPGRTVYSGAGINVSDAVKKYGRSADVCAMIDTTTGEIYAEAIFPAGWH